MNQYIEWIIAISSNGWYRYLIAEGDIEIYNYDRYVVPSNYDLAKAWVDAFESEISRRGQQNPNGYYEFVPYQLATRALHLVVRKPVLPSQSLLDADDLSVDFEVNTIHSDSPELYIITGTETEDKLSVQPYPSAHLLSKQSNNCARLHLRTLN